MNSTRNTDDRWIPCPAGFLQQFAAREHALLRRGTLGKSLVITLLLGVIAWAANFSYQTINPASVSNPNGELTCREVLTHLSDFQAGTLDQEISEKIERHLGHCLTCRQRLSAGDTGSLPATTSSGAACPSQCPNCQAGAAASVN